MHSGLRRVRGVLNFHDNEEFWLVTKGKGAREARMTDRERFVACLLGEPVDRPPYWLFWSPWATTWARWEREGKPAEARNHRSSFNADQPPLSVPVNCGPCPRMERRILDESEDFGDSDWGHRYWAYGLGFIRGMLLSVKSQKG